MFFRARIRKRLHRFLLDVSLSINEGEYVVMLGPSGAGKSMTLKIIAGIEVCSSQEITIKEREISGLPPEKREIVYLPQKDSLFPHMNVMKNILFPFRAKGEREDRALLDRVVKTFKIEAILDRMPNQISGGEAKRVALARAICARPRLLLMDEPLTHLDFHIRMQLIKFLKKIADEYEITVLHVTHDPIETYLLAQRIYLIRVGRIVAEKIAAHSMDIDNSIKKLSHFLDIPSF